MLQKTRLPDATWNNIKSHTLSKTHQRVAVSCNFLTGGCWEGHRQHLMQTVWKSDEETLHPSPVPEAASQADGCRIVSGLARPFSQCWLFSSTDSAAGGDSPRVEGNDEQSTPILQPGGLSSTGWRLDREIHWWGMHGPSWTVRST